jgi:hypothetical protein
MRLKMLTTNINSQGTNKRSLQTFNLELYTEISMVVNIVAWLYLHLINFY